MNVVCTGDGDFVEVQGTAEGAPFDRAELDALLDLAVAGCAELTALQLEALAASSWPNRPRCAGPRPARARHPQRQQDRRAAPDPGRGRASRPSLRRPRRRSPAYPTSPRPALTFAENALLKAARPSLPPDCRRSPTTAACASTRSTACRASSRRAGRAGTATTPPTWPSLLAQLVDVADEHRRRRIRLRGRAGPPGRPGAGRRGPARGDAGARAPRHRTASATTRSSCPTGRADHRRDDPRGEGRDQPPRPGLPCPGGCTGCVGPGVRPRNPPQSCLGAYRCNGAITRAPTGNGAITRALTGVMAPSLARNGLGALPV